MRYDYEVNGVVLKRDQYFEQFSETIEDMKCNYWIEVNGEPIDESEDPKVLAKNLRKMAKQFEKIADFLGKKK